MVDIIQQIKIDYEESKKVIDYYKHHKMLCALPKHQVKLTATISIKEYIVQLAKKYNIEL